MKINKLYNFIRGEVDSLLTNTLHMQVTNFTLKVNKAGVNCAFYELPLNVRKELKFTNAKTYKLLNHHISFYAVQKDNDPNLSQYHYTGYFAGEDNLRYQLHVYFDNNDQPVRSTLSANDVEQGFDKDDINRSTRFALANCSNVMADIRRKHDESVTILETDYNNIEKDLCLLSEDSAKPAIEYQEKVDAILNILKALTNYHYDERYKHLLCLFENMTKLGVEIPNTSPAVTIAQPEVKKYDDTSIDQTLSIVVSKPRLQARIRDALAISKKLLKTKLPAQKAELLLELYEKINTLFLLAEDDKFLVTAYDLQQINSLFIDNKKSIENFLLVALMHKDFENIKPFRGVIKFFPLNWLPLALKTANEVMLDFLLEYGNFCLNTITVSGNLNAVQYCYKQGKKLLGCLTVLIKHKASLLSNAEDGLPIAHHILADKYHFFRSALLQNFDITLGSKKFYKSLIYQLEICLSDLALLDSAKAKILSCINIYNLDLMHVTTHGKEKAYLRLSSVAQEIALNHNDIKPHVTTLENDPECQRKAQALHRAIAEFKKNMRSSASYKLNLKSLDIQKKLSDLLKMTENRLRMFGPEAIKQGYIESINEQINVLRSIQELNIVQEKLKNPGQLYNKQKVTEFNELKKREQELRDEIEPTVEKYDYLKNATPENLDNLGNSKILKTLAEFQADVTNLIECLQLITNIPKGTSLLDSSPRQTHGFFTSSDSSLDSEVSSDEDKDEDESKLDKQKHANSTIEPSLSP
jgi:hypothetical protein